MTPFLCPEGPKHSRCRRGRMCRNGSLRPYSRTAPDPGPEGVATPEHWRLVFNV